MTELHGVNLSRDLLAPARDGKRLATDLWLRCKPQGAESLGGGFSTDPVLN